MELIKNIACLICTVSLTAFPFCVLVLIWRENDNLGLRLIASSVFIFVFSLYIFGISRSCLDDEKKNNGEGV